MPLGNRDIYFRGFFSSVLSKFEKYHPSGNLKCNNLGIFHSLKLRNLMGKKTFEFILSYSLQKL